MTLESPSEFLPTESGILFHVTRQDRFRGLAPDVDVAPVGLELPVLAALCRQPQLVYGGAVRVYAVFGSSDIDLHGANIADEGATINIIASFGSVRFLAPEDWNVNIQTRAVFGGVASKRVAPTSPAGQLTLTGLCLFGGVEIKS